MKLKCDICKSTLDITHLSTISLWEQEQIMYKADIHNHICMKCLGEYYGEKLFLKVQNAERKILLKINEVKNESR